MHKADIQVDPTEATALEARRNREKQRQSRIFNARYRTMGVDADALKNQVEERKLRENAEKRRDEAFDADRIQCDRIAQMLEEEERQRKKQLNQELEEFRQQKQQPPTRREWDIHDPAAVRKGHPARVSDYDPRCGPSSLQRFAGEDLEGAVRRKQLQEKNKQDLEEQRAEREKALADRKYANTLDDKKRIELDLRALELASLEDECRRAKAMAIADFNRAQAAEVAEKQRLAQQREQDDNNTEIYNHLTGDLLTENPDVAKSLVGPHRMVPYRWKGMSPEQLEAIRKRQKEQCKENQAKAAARTAAAGGRMGPAAPLGRPGSHGKGGAGAGIPPAAAEDPGRLQPAAGGSTEDKLAVSGEGGVLQRPHSALSPAVQHQQPLMTVESFKKPTLVARRVLSFLLSFPPSGRHGKVQRSKLELPHQGQYHRGHVCVFPYDFRWFFSSWSSFGRLNLAMEKFGPSGKRLCVT